MKIKSLVLTLAVGFVCSWQLSAQDVLPFPPTPSASTAGITIAESTYKNRVKENHLPEDAPNVVIFLVD
ncbi:MAG: hypothetical protein ACK5MI_08670, partial [Mangrovibacterium sp.]